MARMIDGDKLVENLRLIATCWSVSPYVSKEKHNGAVDMLREVEREVKEAPTLTPPNEPERAGLYGKYTVYKNKDGSLVTDCFILRPAKDPAAVAALRAYAAATNNAELAADIINWVGAEPLTLDELRQMDGEPVYIVFSPDISGEKPQFWVLVSVDEWNDIYLANKEGWAFNYEEFLEDVEAIYRRPPEKQEDT